MSSVGMLLGRPEPALRRGRSVAEADALCRELESLTAFEAAEAIG
jgi:hypothetical protein